MLNGSFTAVAQELSSHATTTHGLYASIPLASEVGPWWALDRWARFITESDGRVISSDPLARLILEKKLGVFLLNGRLAAVERKCQPALEGNLRAPLGARKCIVLPAGNAGRLLLQTIRFARASSDAVAMSARLIGDDFTPEYKGLAEAFDLTSAEEVVAQQLLRGLTPSEISESCNLSIHTIRTHIAHVHAKLGVKSREAMWSRCAAFQIG